MIMVRKVMIPTRKLLAAATWSSARRMRSDAVAVAEEKVSSLPAKCPLKSATVPAGSPAIPVATLPYAAIPSPKGLPVVGTILDLIRGGGTANLHLYCSRRHRELGPIYRETLGVVESVFVADADLIKRLYTDEGDFPMHLVPEPWTIYNKQTNNPRGLFFMDGPLWKERRLSMNKVFFSAMNKTGHADSFNEIVTDVLQRWETELGADGEVPDLENTIYRWSIESLGALIFHRRMGCLSDDGFGDVSKFVHSVQQIFTESAKMTMFPPKIASALKLPVWNRFVEAVSTSLTMANGFVEDTIKEIAARTEAGQESDGILAQLFLKDKIATDELVRIVTDLFVAAADTTSHSVQWALYLLAKNPNWQETIFKEIQKVVPPGTILNNEHLEDLPIVKAIVKESLRMYPVAPFLTRILSKDTALNGYLIPAGKLVCMSLYTTCRDPKYFAQPDVFNPARWLRKEDSLEKIESHACLPFGFGSRACIGRRVAEIQMHLLLARTLQKFHLQLANTSDVEIKLRMITTPSENIRLRLIKRDYISA